MQVSQMKRAISQEQWKQRIVECRNSGVPVKEWCREQGMECLGQVSLFNEAEMYADASVPEATAKKVHGKKKVGKQKENVSRLPLRVQNQELPEEELVSVFGENGWKRLPDKVAPNTLAMLCATEGFSAKTNFICICSFRKKISSHTP